VRNISDLASRRVFAFAGVHLLFHPQSSFAESEVDENYEDKTGCHDYRQEQDEQGGIIRTMPKPKAYLKFD
jgi:hypothetical protein